MMADYWTRPEKVDAVQWHRGEPPLPGAQGQGCAVCGPGFASGGFYNSCVNPGEHDPARHPSFLLVGTSSGTEALFDGFWLVVFPDGKRQVCSPIAFAARFMSEHALWHAPTGAYVPVQGSASTMREDTPPVRDVRLRVRQMGQGHA